MTAGTSSDASDDGGNGNADNPSDQPTSDEQTPTEEASQGTDEGTSDGSDTSGDQSTTPSASTPGNTQSGNGGHSSKHHPHAKLQPSTLDLSEKNTATLSLWGFTPGTKVSLTVPEGLSTDSPTVTTGKHGGKSVTVHVDSSVEDGKYVITATDLNDPNERSASAELTVDAPDQSSNPAITLGSKSIEAGKSLKVTGTDFPTDDPVTVIVTDSHGKTVGRPKTDDATAAGAISTNISIPGTTPADNKCTVTATTESGDTKVSAPLTVTSPKGPGTDGPSNTPTGGTGGGSGSGTPTTDKPSTDTPSNSTTSPSSSSTSDAPSTTSTSPSTSSGSRSASTTSEVPPATSTRDSSKEIELSAPSNDSSSKSTEKSEKKDTSEKPTKDEKSEKAKDEDKKTSDTPQQTSDQPVSDQQSDATQAAATMDDDDTTSSGPTTVTTQDDGGGPLVKLFSSIGGEDASGMDRIRQVFIATLGVGFLTALGFTAASWLSRRSGTHSARAGLRQLFHRRH
ncbi:hypothetical protein I8D64_05240 [Brachybacterium sp. MASK1Z-5]|uniref:Uncharacterized protein n=1 Tax=Brachybacterium halotolerans TaxID=2795215 RepID=A0ABS1B8I3_9MICO|nr:hypothetical protein [Brachybacterium halotolerans]MBK0330802.1 hypothetical protein [Brachybacterium halotolerans]